MTNDPPMTKGRLLSLRHWWVIGGSFVICLSFGPRPGAQLGPRFDWLEPPHDHNRAANTDAGRRSGERAGGAGGRGRQGRWVLPTTGRGTADRRVGRIGLTAP